LKVDDRIIPIYQCETCTIPWEVDGQVFPTAFTFGIRESGEWFDPAHYGDPKLN
jgi:hypothetical protein